MLWLSTGSTLHMYQYLCKYIVVVLMKPSWINPGDNIINHIIHVIFWRNMYDISIRQEIIPNKPFNYSRQYLVILKNHLRMLINWSFSISIDFGDTRESSFRSPYCIYPDKINKTVGKSQTDSWELVSHMINGYHDLLWCDCSSVRWR